jgi:hypothetical protein
LGKAAVQKAGIFFQWARGEDWGQKKGKKLGKKLPCQPNCHSAIPNMNEIK